MSDRQLDELLYKYLQTDEKPRRELEQQLCRRMARRRHRRPWVIALKSAAAAAAAAMLAIVVLANTGKDLAYAMQQLPILGPLVKAVTFRTYEDAEKDFSAYVEIPEIEGLGRVSDEINRQISAYADALIEMYEGDKAVSGAEGHYALTTGYHVLTDNDRYFSIEVWTTIAMAGSNSFNKYFTVDKKQERLLSMADLFDPAFDYKTAIYNEIVRQMQEQMEQDASAAYFLKDGKDDIPGADDSFYFNSITGEENFYIAPDNSLVIVFDKYEVAPGTMGLPRFNVGRVQDGRLVLEQ